VRTAALLLAIAFLGCGAIRGAAPTAREPAAGGEPGASRDPVEAVCASDRLRDVRARFRANVAVGSERSSVEGILLVHRPGAIRVKLFGIAGLTVHDAIWRGDASGVRGRIAGVDRSEPLSLVQTPDAPLEQPEARFSLLLWSLWQPRCARPPQPVAGVPATFALDPAPAQARSREVRLVEGAGGRGEAGSDGREASADRGDVASGDVASDRGEVGRDVLVASDGERIVVGYSDYDRTLAVPLPRRIELGLPAAGWAAEVVVSDYDFDEPLDEALFALPEDERRP
jgi:hypothetical protein